MLYGSVLNYIVHILMPGLPKDNLAAVWCEAKRLYKELQVPKENRYGTMKLTMFKVSDGSCKLRGTVMCLFVIGLHRSFC